MSLQISVGFRFGGFLLDHSAGGLFRLDRHGGAVPVMLGSRALDVLGVLVERQGELVPKQAIMDAVWPDTAVEENNLTVQISALRRVLDQGRTDGSCIQTITGRGYRFVVAVPDPAAAPEGASAARLEPLAEPGGICISAHGREDAAGKMALEVDDLGTPELSAPLPLPDKPSLAVLPFQNMSGDPEQEYFADGMVEEITTALSRVRSLFVIARNSAFTYKGRATDVRQVGRELGVRYVLEGSVRQAGLRVRITSQLVEAATGTHLWADRFEGTLEDVFDLQDRVAASVVAAIETNLFGAEIVRAQHKPGNLQAYDLLLRAMLHMQVRTRASVTEAERLLRNALRIDPDYGPAMARLATCQWIMVLQNWVDRADPAVREMVKLARAALALDGSNPMVLLHTSFIIALPGGDLSDGITLINRSLELNPNSAFALQRAGLLHAYAGDKQLAIAQLERSVSLYPLARAHFEFYFSYALAHFVAGEFERAADWTSKAVQQFPNYTASLRFRAASLGMLGRLEEGRQVVQRLLALVPDFTITRARRHIEFDMNNVFKRPGVADALYEGLRRCGVPE
jgi:TolB-like protein/DNA-binding winged helix-turn-helix (wHTH) protein